MLVCVWGPCLSWEGKVLLLLFSLCSVSLYPDFRFAWWSEQLAWSWTRTQFHSSSRQIMCVSTGSLTHPSLWKWTHHSLKEEQLLSIADSARECCMSSCLLLWVFFARDVGLTLHALDHFTVTWLVIWPLLYKDGSIFCSYCPSGFVQAWAHGNLCCWERIGGDTWTNSVTL